MANKVSFNLKTCLEGKAVYVYHTKKHRLRKKNKTVSDL